MDVPRYEPHSIQQAFHASHARTKVSEWSRRLGKSRSALYELVDIYQQSQSVPVPDSVTPPFHAWIVAPSFPQSTQVWTELMTFIPKDWFARDPLQDQKQIFLKGTPERAWGLIEVKSAHDPENLQTAGLDFLWVTESQDINNRAFEKLLPMLRSPNRMGKAVFEGIPAMYPDHWWWRMCEHAQFSKKPEEYFYSHGTVYQNPFLSEQDIKEIEEDKYVLTDSAWRRMYLAERNQESGYFKNVSNCISGDKLSVPLPGVRYVAGLDLGRKRDYTVLWIGDASQRRAVAHYTWGGEENWVTQRENIASILREWDIERVIGDSTGLGDVFLQELENMDIPVEPYVISAPSRRTLLETLAVAIERETIHFPSEELLLRQLRAFQFRRTNNGGWRAEAPPGEHDDEVFSIALMTMALDPAPETSVIGTAKARGAMRYLPDSMYYGSNRVPAGVASRREQRSERRKDRLERSGATGVLE